MEKRNKFVATLWSSVEESFYYPCRSLSIVDSRALVRKIISLLETIVHRRKATVKVSSSRSVVVTPRLLPSSVTRHGPGPCEGLPTLPPISTPNHERVFRVYPPSSLHSVTIIPQPQTHSQCLSPTAPSPHPQPLQNHTQTIPQALE